MATASLQGREGGRACSRDHRFGLSGGTQLTTPIRFSSRDGLELEGLLDEGAPEKAVVLCHPHPQMGGTMNAPLLGAVAEDLSARGFSTLRFNFRGIGTSQGSFGLGIDEVQDALGALDEIESRWPDAAIGIAGWSFGAAVALRTCPVSDVVACAAIAPAVRTREGVTAGLPPADELEIQQPLLVVCAENDDQIPLFECTGWAEGVPGATCVTMPGANHFFWAQYERLSRAVGNFFERHVAGEVS